MLFMDWIFLSVCAIALIVMCYLICTFPLTPTSFNKDKDNNKEQWWD